MLPRLVPHRDLVLLRKVAYFPDQPPERVEGGD